MMNFVPVPRRSSKRLALGSLKQPDSLRLSVSLAILKHLHKVCERIENKFGDKATERTLFLKGVQGRVAMYCSSRDYTYFLAKVQEVRVHLMTHCVQSALDDLMKAALDIYNRFDNRRRMGIEIIVLATLTNKNSVWFEIPDKYHSKAFVLEMLVSCRHRFQKPEKSFFWSRQSEALLSSIFLQTRNLTVLKLALANDGILKTIAANCRHLHELELQLAMDVTDEGLCALGGKSLTKLDFGNARAPSTAYNLDKDFGLMKEWYVKDALLFTPLPIPKTWDRPEEQLHRSSENTHSSFARCTSKFYDTGFGCLELVKLRINGEFIFPPLAKRFKDVPLNNRIFKGPILEAGFYCLLLSLKKIQKFTMNGLPLVIAKLIDHLPPELRFSCPLPLQTLTLEHELLTSDEFSSLAFFCSKFVTELINVTPNASADKDDLDVVEFGLLAHRYFSPNVCSFISEFPRLQSFQGRIPMPCLNESLRVCGETLTRIHLTTVIHSMWDILILRKFAVNLEALEGKFVVCRGGGEALSHRQLAHYRKHNTVALDVSLAQVQSAFSSKFSSDLLSVLAKYPMRKLVKIDIEGSVNILTMQLMVGHCEQLEELYINNNPPNQTGSPVNRNGGGGGGGQQASYETTKALSDEWLEALVFVNRLPSIKNVTLRMDNEQTVECGSFTESGLTKFLDHCLEHCQKLNSLVGEFTRIPDKTLAAKAKTYRRKGLRRLRIRNAVPYRRFENSFETERHYSVNEGYHAMLHEQVQQQQQFFQQHHFQAHLPPINLADNHQGQDAAGHHHREQSDGKSINSSKRFYGYVFRPYPGPLSSSDESESD